MSIYYANSMDFNGRPNQHSNISLPINKNNEQIRLADRAESVSLTESALIDVSQKLKRSAGISRSLDGYSSVFFDDARKYGESLTLHKRVDRPSRYKYCFLGQPKLKVKKENVHDFIPSGQFARYKSTDKNIDEIIDLTESKCSVPEVNSHSCNSMYPETENIVGNSISKVIITDLDYTTEDITGEYPKARIRTLPGENKRSDLDCNCRICHAGTNTGQLISPCHCTGTMGQLHAACLEEWLSFNGRNDCEVCGYEYPVQKESRSFKEFLKYPGDTSLSRDLKHDRWCFAIFTPTTLLLGALLLYAASFPKWRLTPTTIGLILTTLFLVMSYISWSVMAYTFQRQVWQKWRNDNQIVRLKRISSNYSDCQDSQQGSITPKPSMIENNVCMSLSNEVDTSRETLSGVHIQSRRLNLYDDQKLSASADDINLDINPHQKSNRDIRGRIGSTSSSTCSIAMETAFSDVMSAREMSMKKLKFENERKTSF